MSEADRHQDLERLQQYLRAEYARDVQAEFLRDIGPKFTKFATRVVLIQWMQANGVVSFVDPNARVPSDTALSTAYSESELNEFVRVLNENVIEGARIDTAFFYAGAAACVFQIDADYARKVFSGWCNTPRNETLHC